ncbi:hypothetical protein HYC85_013777 [Camellia sinensis]|uniref:Secreted protein n=1 Tax=Camellia sinensis TaxID=4442 RepID=A0A7J7H4C3_CAMSI|nr:hypothetical protein HYC85_013777 [Camellia sinensis]
MSLFLFSLSLSLSLISSFSLLIADKAPRDHIDATAATTAHPPPPLVVPPNPRKLMQNTEKTESNLSRRPRSDCRERFILICLHQQR